MNVVPDIEYCRRGERRLLGDLYLPEGTAPVPLVLLVPGAGWRVADRRHLAHWASWLADEGFAAFSVEYTTAPPGAAGSFPAAVHDVRAAIRAAQAGALSDRLDGRRIAVLGESAGATVAALAALGRHEPLCEPGIEQPTPVQALVGIYGSYDMAARWRSQLRLNEPAGQGLCRGFLGAELYDDPRRYFDASPLSQVSYDNARGLQAMLAWGCDDPMVPPEEHSVRFALALQQARAFVLTYPVPGAGHFWFQTDPVSEAGSPNAWLAPRLRRFLQRALAVRAPA